MKNKISFLILIALLFASKSFSQVTTSIVDVTVNSQTIVNNCNLIDFGSTTNNSLNFYFKLTKPSSQAIGTCNLKILLKYSSSTGGSERGQTGILSNNWANGTEVLGNIQCNISQSEIQVTGSSIYIELTTDSGVKTSSCEYPLQKTQVPVFNLSPTSTTVGCGSTSPYTFSVANVYNSPGTLTYQWSYSGWSGTVNSSLSSVTLTPSSTTSFPSNVSVTPYLNGVAQPTRTCTINWLPFSSSATITGNNSSCTIGSSSIYTINAGVGNTVTWSSSNSNCNCYRRN